VLVAVLAGAKAALSVDGLVDQLVGLMDASMVVQ